MGLQSWVEWPHLVLDRETAMEWDWKGWVHEENLAGTGAMGREGRGTETETGGKDPGGPGRARSESRCCIAALGRGPCGHLGRPESEESKRRTSDDAAFRRAAAGEEGGTDLVLIVRLLGHKHLLQLQVQSLDATSQTGGQSVQGQQGQRLRGRRPV